MDPGSVVMLGLLVVIFYFMLIRPQQRRLRQHQALLASLEEGDEVVTIGGIHGVVRRLGEDEVTLEVAEGTLIRFARQAISKKLEPDGTDAEDTGAEARSEAGTDAARETRPEVEPQG